MEQVLAVGNGPDGPDWGPVVFVALWCVLAVAMAIGMIRRRNR